LSINKKKIFKDPNQNCFELNLIELFFFDFEFGRFVFAKKKKIYNKQISLSIK